LGASRQRDCSVCHHPVADHRHYNSIWKTENDVETVVDKDAEKKYMDAEQSSAKTEVTMIELQQAVDKMGEDMTEALAEVAVLTASYAKLSLSGSFAGQVEKSVRLLELTLEGMRCNGTEPETIRIVEESLNSMKAKLQVVEQAAARAGKSIFKFDFPKWKGVPSIKIPWHR